MRSFSRKLVMLCLAFSVQGVAAVQAATEPPTSEASTPQRISVLAGKLTYTLPQGYVERELPELDAQARARGMTGTMYVNAAQKRMVVVTETPVPEGSFEGDNDEEFLLGLANGTISKHESGYQDFRILREKEVVKNNGLGILEIDAYGTLGNDQLLNTTLLAASGRTAAYIHLISPRDTRKTHIALIKAIIGE